MIWLARLKLLVAVTAALILAAAGVACQGRQKPYEGAQTRPAHPQSAGPAADAGPGLAANRALARKQLALIDETWDFLLALAPHSRIEIGSGLFGQWGRRRLEALHKAGAGKAEIVAALEKYIKDLEKLEAIAKAQLEAARATPLGVHEMQFMQMEAEIWLNEEKAR